MQRHRNLPDRALEGLSREQIAAIDNLSRPVRGGVVKADELCLAEALLLAVLTTAMDRDGIGGPLRAWDRPAARFHLSKLMHQAWHSLLDGEILAIHRSTPSAAFASTDVGSPVPLPDEAHWFICRGRAGDTPADAREATWAVVHDALRSTTWPDSWVLEAPQVADDLIVAEGLAYFYHLLEQRGRCPLPTEEAELILKRAMEDAAADCSIGQIFYLAFKPIAQAVDPYRFVKARPSSAVVDTIVTEFTRRAPRYRANDWQIGIYDHPAQLPLAGVCAALFTVLELDPRTDTSGLVAEAAEDRADEVTRNEMQHWALEDALLQAGPLPAGAWDNALQALRESQAPAAFQDIGWPPAAHDYYEATQRRSCALSATVVDYLVQIDAMYPDDQARHLANAYSGATLLAHGMLRQENHAMEIDEAHVLAAGLQDCLLTAYAAARQNATETISSPH